MREVSRNHVVLVLGGFLLLLFGLVIVSWSRWIFLWDGFGHRGVYLCSIAMMKGHETRQCSGDVDQLVYEEVTLPGGGRREAWFAGGTFEVRRVLQRPGSTTVDLRREFGDTWAGPAEGVEPPFGRTACTCTAQR